MLIRRALSSLPSKPGLIIAIIIMLTVTLLYYINQYNRCSDIASLRTHFYAKTQAASPKLNLVDIIPFEWERVRIIVNFQNQGKLLHCPFGWDWTQQQRQQLMAKNRLSVLAFAKKNNNIIIDFDADIVKFALTDKVFTPASAKFHIDKRVTDKTRYILSEI